MRDASPRDRPRNQRAAYSIAIPLGCRDRERTGDGSRSRHGGRALAIALRWRAKREVSAPLETAPFDGFVPASASKLTLPTSDRERRLDQYGTPPGQRCCSRT